MTACFLLALALTGATVDVLGGPAPFALEPGFVEVIPDTPLTVMVVDAAVDDELVVDLVRLGPLGKGRAKAVVSAGALKRTLVVLSPTEASRKVGPVHASIPIRQRVPLPTGTTRVQLVADGPLAVRFSVEKRPPPGAIPLVPLTAPPATAPPATATAPPASGTVPPASETAPPAAGTAPPATATAPPATATAPPATAPEEPAGSVRGAPTVTTAPPWPRLMAEVHAGASAVANGLNGIVPGGGVRVLVGPRSLDAALGFALDFDGQGEFVGAGRWDMSSTRVRLEGHLGVGDLTAIDGRVGVTVGAGGRFSWHTASFPGVRRNVFVVGTTARLAPELSMPAGPGRFAVALPLDVSIDMPSDIQGFAPVAVGILLGYRLEL